MAKLFPNLMKTINPERQNSQKKKKKKKKKGEEEEENHTKVYHEQIT